MKVPYRKIYDVLKFDNKMGLTILCNILLTLLAFGHIKVLEILKPVIMVT